MLTAVKERAKSMRSYVYDTIIVSMTLRWYREVLFLCPMAASVLDVGIGTATSLIGNRDLVISKQLAVTGVDYDLDYVRSAQANVAAHNLQDQVRIEHASIHDFNATHTDKFDVVYFSGSFMILPDQSAALRHCVAMLRSPVPKAPGAGNIFFTQTFETRTFIGQFVTPYVKRALRAITTIDFGEVTYEDDFRAALDRAAVDIVETRPLKDSRFRTQTLVVARPRLTDGQHRA